MLPSPFVGGSGGEVATTTIESNDSSLAVASNKQPPLHTPTEIREYIL